MAKTPDSRRHKSRRDKAPPQTPNAASAKGASRGGNKNTPRGEKPSRGGKPQQRRPSAKASGNALWIYGRHAALAALANPRRVITAVRATEAFVDTREDDLAAARRTRPTLKIGRLSWPTVKSCSGC